MNDAEKNTSAGRLFQIMASAKRLAGKPVLSWALWTAALQTADELPENSDASPTEEQTNTVVRGLMQFKQLIDETEASLGNIEGLGDRYFEPFKRIRNLPMLALQSLLADVSGHLKVIPDRDLLALEFCAEKLAFGS